jgi:LacI family transcriptional regulator
MPITIHDVARKLNLSITTVSRALDGYQDVAEETRQRVIAVAHEMGYSPNQAARQLRRQHTDTIGYILPSETSHFSDPFFAEFITGLGDEASMHGFDLLVATAPPDQPVEKQTYQRWTNGHKVDGVVLNRVRLHDWRIQYLAHIGFPFVTLERSLDPQEYPSVEVNGQHWFKLLVEHMISFGHREIAYIGASLDLKIQADRFAGYHEALVMASIPINPAWVLSEDLTATGGYRAAQTLLNLPKPPRAIACIDDMTAIGVMHAVHEHGLRVGKDIAVSGFDGILGFEHTQPPLTTVNQPVYQIARQLVGMLVAQIRGEPLLEWHVTVEPGLEIRESTIGKKKQ